VNTTKSRLSDIWPAVLNILKTELDPHNYSTWVNSARPLAYHNGTLVIAATDEFTKAWLENRYSNLIRAHLEAKLNHIISLRFVGPNDADQEHFALSREINTSPQLNPKYTFDSFVIGNSNRFAHAASLAVAENPAGAYNPLFLYGGVGLGKTHLMQAIGHFVLKYNSSLKVVYVSSETFTNDVVIAIRENKTVDLRNKYRMVDILLIDDIQFVAFKESTKEEFFHTFNSLYEADKQIVISCDRPPREIPGLEERLRSRFEWGLLADIQPPDLETRIAILSKKAQNESFTVPDDILLFIASKIVSNIRELEGALLRVIAYATIHQLPINMETTHIALKDIFSDTRTRNITVYDIQKAVANFFNVKMEDFKTRRRTNDVAFPRQVAMYLARKLADASLTKIGEEFGGRDHTTVMHACDRITEELSNNSNLQAKINDIIKFLQSS
jgi:chromosomal replication initiator protein